MLTVHHLGISQSERIVWLCEELEIPYQLVRYDRDPNTQLAPEKYKVPASVRHRARHHRGQNGVGETGAIMEYIIAKHGGGRLVVGAEKPNFADYLFWFHFANGSFMPSAMTDLVVTIMGGGEGTAPHIVNALRSRGQRAWQMTEARLEEVPYLAGNEFTAADIISVFSLTTLRAFVPRDLAEYPGVRAYLKRIQRALPTRERCRRQSRE